MRRRVEVLIAAASISLAGASNPASSHAMIGQGKCGGRTACAGNGGQYTGLHENYKFEKKGAWKPDGGGQGSGGGKPKQVPYEYTTTMACMGARPGQASGELGCTQAMTYCQVAVGRPATYTRVFRRLLGPNAQKSAWDQVGDTCWPEKVPGDSKPQLTMAMIKEAWTHTAFAKPALSMQPVGNRTLVTLPTYFQVSWPTVGFQPDEVRAVTLLGQRVEIRPRFKQVTYSFGDGASMTTTSLGGPYPSGDVTHAYAKPATVTVSSTATYGGQFRLGGGDWVDVPGTIDVAGPTQQLQVLAAKNRLVNQ
ncbi:hypothetical protein PZ938_16565 [Luteipulveratus sp. YIM 133132]|uniref:hypothetical protein n=1 Tax=Luteipulveratus flavus TaxID=3031728 RepID=UPI0023AF589D|nr:hypothetical protein [Luteipulveratus sp. YIM 133132]MDE9367234.1 hypothetical protein [Luteipulveratus sp. YIM 133132]